jgi:hypothetical protein
MLINRLLPAALIASFIKRLSRLALVSPPAGIIMLIPFIYNLFKRHPGCMVMIQRMAPEDDDVYSGEFLSSTSSPDRRGNTADGQTHITQKMSTHSLLTQSNPVVGNYHPSKRITYHQSQSSQRSLQRYSQNLNSTWKTSWITVTVLYVLPIWLEMYKKLTSSCLRQRQRGRSSTILLLVWVWNWVRWESCSLVKILRKRQEQLGIS